jgi:hypothetical protein
VQLAHYLELPLAAVPASITEYTTTDIAAACSVAGLQMTKGGKKTVSVGWFAGEVLRVGGTQGASGWWCGWCRQSMNQRLVSALILLFCDGG